MGRWYPRLVLAALLSGGLATPSVAAIIAADSCEQADVVAAIAAASSGDTVLIPARPQVGDCTWTATVWVPNTKALTLRGAGRDATIITVQTDMHALALESPNASRVTGMEFNYTSGTSFPMLQVDGTGWRVDHCRFRSTVFREGVNVRGTRHATPPSGVVDHNEFLNTRVWVEGDLYAFHEDMLTHTQWAQPLDLGGPTAVFVEDNTFTCTVFCNVMDGHRSGRYVFRYNVVTDGYIETHSLDGASRGMRSWEVYHNTLHQVSMSIYMPFRMRGGTGVIWANTLTGTFINPTVGVDNYRSCYDYVAPGYLCGGGSLFDGNQPIPTGGTATHDGSPNAATLQDLAQNWPVNELRSTYVNQGTGQETETAYFWVRNTTDGSQGTITANTATTVTATLAGGSENDWDVADAAEVSNGWPCRDQIGRSTDQWLWTDANPYPPQASDPAYQWQNTINGVPMGTTSISCALSQRHVVVGRDIIEGERPGYTPYAYPHPLTQEPSAPFRLRFAQ